MKKTILQILFLLFIWPPLFAQSVNVLGDTTEIRFAVLPDKAYTFNQVLKDKRLAFVAMDSLLNAKAYWLRIVLHNPKSDDQNYILKAYPNINTCLYIFRGEKWTSHCSGIEYGNKPWLLGRHPYHLNGRTQDTLYVKVNVAGPNIVNNRFKARIEITSEAKKILKQQNMKTAWLVGCVVLLLFFFNNLCLYLGLRDKTVRYYLWIQLGSMLYLTSYWFFFDFGKAYIFSYILANELYYYEFNKLLTHISILIIFFGLVQLTRTYLNTREHLPLEDRLLKYVLNIYIFLSLLLILINVSGFYIDYYTLIYDNIYCALLILLVIYTSIKAYIKKTPLSEPYLLANLLPLIFIFSIPVYHLLVSGTSSDNYWLPVFGVISQALGFSIALLTRTKAMADALKVSEMESQQLEFNMKEISYLHKVNELELEKRNTEISLEKGKNEYLQQRLEINQRELASSTLNMVQKSELLTLLREQIQKLNWMDRYHTKKNVEELNQLLQSNILLDSEWDKFKLHFEQVHPDFFENLKTQHPTLTAKEIRLYAYFKMKLSHKEIAALFDIDPASVRRAKTRLLKKMNQG